MACISERVRILVMSAAKCIYVSPRSNGVFLGPSGGSAQLAQSEEQFQRIWTSPSGTLFVTILSNSYFVSVVAQAVTDYETISVG